VAAAMERLVASTKTQPPIRSDQGKFRHGGTEKNQEPVAADLRR
jgi:hypothetical protein